MSNSECRIANVERKTGRLSRFPRRPAAFRGPFALDDLLRVAAVGVHDIERAGVRPLVGVLESDLLAVRRPCRQAVQAAQLGKLLLVRAIGFDDKDLKTALAR